MRWKWSWKFLPTCVVVVFDNGGFRHRQYFFFNLVIIMSCIRNAFLHILHAPSIHIFLGSNDGLGYRHSWCGSVSREALSIWSRLSPLLWTMPWALAKIRLAASRPMVFYSSFNIVVSLHLCHYVFAFRFFCLCVRFLWNICHVCVSNNYHIYFFGFILRSYMCCCLSLNFKRVMIGSSTLIRQNVAREKAWRSIHTVTLSPRGLVKLELHEFLQRLRQAVIESLSSTFTLIVFYS